MKKILVLLSILCLWTNMCFAEDIFVSEDDGYTLYVRTESISGSYSVRQGDKNAYFYTKYSVIFIPNAKTLKDLKTQTLDNRIEYKKEDYATVRPYNRVDEIWGNTSLSREGVSLWGEGEKLFTSTNTSYMPIIDDSKKAELNRKTLYIIYGYADTHKDLIKTIVTK